MGTCDQSQFKTSSCYCKAMSNALKRKSKKKCARFKDDDTINEHAAVIQLTSTNRSRKCKTALSHGTSDSLMESGLCAVKINADHGSKKNKTIWKNS